jgi:hypothetical protein
LGHPFATGENTGVQSASYWSATTLAVNPAGAWYVNFFNGDVNTAAKSFSTHAWCVRGPMSESVY